MSSAAQIAANRRNARRSTGPRSVAGKIRSRRNALRHGLAVPIATDLEFGGRLERLAKALAGEAVRRDRQPAAAAFALAELELDRARQAKARMLNREARLLQESQSVEPEHSTVLAFSAGLKVLARIARYENRAVSKRKHALRELYVLPSASLPPTEVVRKRDLFQRPVATLNINALVCAAQEQAQEARCGTWISPELSALRVTVRFESEHTGTLEFAWANAEPSQKTECKEFALVQIAGRRNGRRWAAVCPRTQGRVEDFYFQDEAPRIGSRHSLGLRYRSRSKARRADEHRPLAAARIKTAAPTRKRQRRVAAAMMAADSLENARGLKDQDLWQDAFAMYCRLHQKLQQQIDQGRLNNRVIDDRNRASDGITELAGMLLGAGQNEDALQIANYVCEHDPGKLEAQAYRAHALLLLGRIEEARDQYVKFRGQQVTREQTWEALLLGDFQAMRRHGVQAGLMEEMTALFGVSAT